MKIDFNRSSLFLLTFLLFYGLRCAEEMDYLFDPIELFLPMAFLGLGILVMYKLISFRTETVKASIITLAVFTVSLFYRDIEFFFKSNLFEIRYRTLLIIWIITLIVLIWRIWIVSESKLYRINHYLNILFICLVIYQGILLGKSLVSGNSWKQQLELNVPPIQQLEKRPNIYFILSDAYTNNKALKEYWQYDNSPFTNDLKQMGFIVNDSGSSNYRSTFQTMASVFNASYLKDTSGIKNELLEQNVLRKLIKDSWWGQLLEANGYHIRNYSLFDLGTTKKYYQFNHIAVWDKSGFGDYLLRKSIFFLPFYQYNQIEVPELLDIISKTLDEKPVSPSFTYIHLPIPHLPNYFPNHQVDGIEPPPPYIQQLDYSNGYLLSLVRKILQLDNEAIIIIQGDHGSREAEKNTDAYDAFSAIYMKGENQAEMPASVVNLFPYVLNELGGNIPPKPNLIEQYE